MGEKDHPAPVAIVALPLERWPEYRRLRLEALEREPSAFSSKLADALTFPDEEWRRRLANPETVLRFAERDGRVVGMAGAFFATDGDPEVATIFSVYVAAEHCGQGIGRALMEAVLAEVQARGGIRDVRLNVNAARPAALALYRSLGFAAVGREEPEEPSGVVELIMERPLA